MEIKGKWLIGENGERIYPVANTEVVFRPDGTTVEEALSEVKNYILTLENEINNLLAEIAIIIGE